MGIRTEAEYGSGVYDFTADSPPTLVKRISGFEVPAGGATITELLDSSGIDVLSNYTNTGVLTAGCKIYVNQVGDYFTSVTGSAGQINYLNA